MLDHALVSFVRASLPSIWALEILLLLRSRAGEHVSNDFIVREMRATPSLVSEALSRLASAGLVQRLENDDAYFAPSSPELAVMCAELDAVNRERPVALRNVILIGSLPVASENESGI